MNMKNEERISRLGAFSPIHERQVTYKRSRSDLQPWRRLESFWKNSPPAMKPIKFRGSPFRRIVPISNQASTSISPSEAPGSPDSNRVSSIALLTCPPRLTDGNGNLATGAIGTLIDILGAAVAYEDHLRSKNVSADMSISFISPATLNDELETISRPLGQKGKYRGTHVLVRNKTTGEIVAEGRHSLFRV